MNEFVEALQKAINCEGIEQKCKVTNLDGSDPFDSVMIFDKEGTVGSYQVRWHNRWCFYYKNELIAQYFEYKYSDYVCKGNDISKTLGKKLYPMIIEAVRTVLHKKIDDCILVA